MTCVLHLTSLSVSQMFTVSSERFLKIQREAPLEYQQYLVQVTKYQVAQNCKVCMHAWLHLL
jgi:hypothetical protein